MGRRKGLDIDGVFLLDKAGGLSSNNALQQVRRTLNARKAGHTGSLDPLATGLLPICLGEATKVAGYLLNARKTYRVSAQFGAATDTGDSEGAITERGETAVPSAAAVDEVLARFRGQQQQVPPMFSALKYQGRPLYEYARAGQTVPREARAIDVARIERIATADDELTLEVDVSAGTYVRQLVTDIAAELDRVAHVVALRRSSVGALGGDGAPMTTLEGLRDRLAEEPDGHSLRVGLSSLLADWPAVWLDDESAWGFQNGRPASFSASPEPAASVDDPPYCVYAPEGSLIAIGVRGDDGLCWPKRVFTRPQA